MSLRIAVRVLLGIAFYALGGWFIWKALQGQNVSADLTRIYSWQGVAVVGLLVLARILTSVTWSWLIVTTPMTKQLLLAGGVFALSAPGKYVPGKVFSLIARTAGARALGVSVGAILSASAVEFCLAVAMTAFIGVLIDLWLAADWLALSAGVALVPAAMCLMVAARRLRLLPTPWLQRIESWAGGLQSSRLLIAASFSFLAATCVAAGGALWFSSLESLAARQVAAITADYLQSSALSLMVAIAPAGIGAREVVLSAWLQGVVDRPVIATVLLTTRLLDLIADVAFTLLGAVVCVRLRRANKRSASAA